MIETSALSHRQSVKYDDTIFANIVCQLFLDCFNGIFWPEISAKTTASKATATTAFTTIEITIAKKWL